MKNKIASLIDRGEIRDAYDLEFILRKGIKLHISPEERQKIKKIISNFTIRDYKVALGSLLEKDMRSYYLENNFNYLLEKIVE